MKKKRIKKETAQERKLRLAQELVKRGKEAEQAAWRAKWEKQAKDPVYQQKQAERAAKSEERERTRGINKEIKFLKYAKDVRERMFGDWMDEEMNTAIHEAGHAVLQEIIGRGCELVTIFPQQKKWGTEENKSLLGFSSGRGTDDVFSDAVINMGGGIATGLCGDYDDEYDPEDGMSSGDIELLYKNIERLGINPLTEEGVNFTEKVRAHGEELMSKPEVLAAMKDIAEALLVEKTLQGSAVKAIVLKHRFPDMYKHEISKQYLFHFRINRPTFAWGNEQPSYALGLAIHSNDYYGGYHTREPEYVREFVKKNEGPKPPVVNLEGFKWRMAAQAPLNFTIPIKQSRKKKAA